MSSLGQSRNLLSSIYPAYFTVIVTHCYAEVTIPIFNSDIIYSICVQELSGVVSTRVSV